MGWIDSDNASDYAVYTNDLRVDYGETNAVKGISLRVPKGEIYGLIGPNGAGKTSTFLVLATLMEPTYGDVFIQGHDASIERSVVRQKMTYMPDLAPLPSDLKCGEFLELFAGAYGLRGKEKDDRIQECLEDVDLTDKRNEMCHSLSRGMTQRLVLAKSLLHKPDVLILDEPASGLDSTRRAGLRNSVQKMAKEGSTVIISSHILSELSDMCTSVGLMKDGDLVDSGPVNQVIDRFSGPKTLLKINLLAKQDQTPEWFLQKMGETITIDKGEILLPFEGNEEARAQLLSELVQAGFQPSSFEVQRSSIEDIFLGLADKN